MSVFECILVSGLCKSHEFRVGLQVFQLTNRFHVAVHLSSNRSQMTSKWGKNKKNGTRGNSRVCHFFVLTTFWRSLWSITGQMYRNMESICLIQKRNKLCSHKSCFISHKARESGAFPILTNKKKSHLMPSMIYTKWSNPNGCYALAKNCDWFRQITPLSYLTRVWPLVEWKLTANEEIYK